MTVLFDVEFVLAISYARQPNIGKQKQEQGLTSNCRLSSGSVSASSAGRSEALLLPELMNSITCSSTSGLCSVASSNKPEQHVSSLTGHFLFSYSASKSTTLFGEVKQCHNIVASAVLERNFMRVPPFRYPFRASFLLEI